MTFTHVSISFLLGLFSVFSYINNDITFWINVIILGLVMTIWGMGSACAWMIFADYLPDKIVSLAVMSTNFGRFG